MGIEFGLIVEGWGLGDYLKFAVDDPRGFETMVLHGVQGSGKSSRAIQMGYYIWRHILGPDASDEQVWRSVLDSFVFSPSDFVKKLEAVGEGKRLPLVIWDDIQLNYTSSSFKTDIEQYSSIDSTFAVVRKRLSVCLITVPNISRLPRNIKDNTTIECFVGKNQNEQVRRIFRLPGQRSIDSNLFKPLMQQPSKFDLYKVPPWVWAEYDRMRERIVSIALKQLKGTTDMDTLDGYLPIIDAVATLREKGVPWGLSTVQQLISRSVIKGQKVNGVLNVCLADLDRAVAVETSRPRRKG